ncbi:MAG: hypothetical protein NVS9B15_20830 [Acidobacteriaceae bacterium]
MSKKQKYANYEEFYRYYLTQHAEPSNRAMHAVGTILGLGTAAWALRSGHPWRVFWGLPVAYGFAWIGHLAIERNVPATFEHPAWSFVRDYRMLWDTVRGRMPQVKSGE